MRDAAVRDETEIHPARSAVDWVDSPVGPLVVGATERALCLLHFSDREHLEAELQRARKSYGGNDSAACDLLATLRAELSAYFAGALREFSVPVAPTGSSFQQQVWGALGEIPYGQTRSYLDIALRVGDAGATRAVGAANGANPIAIVIPCHRVVNANGNLGGYGGGLWRKRILLDLEKGQRSLDL
jgi:O-6-methylguanine DNA methyltransferase